VVGKIPNFLGAEAAADYLAALPAWEAAHVLKANPDKAQRPVRVRSLTEGKVLYMAVPRLGGIGDTAGETVCRVAGHRSVLR